MNTLLERNYEYQRNQSTYLIRTEMNNYLHQLIIVQRAVRIRLGAANTLSGTTTEMNALRNEQVAPESDFNPIRPRGRRGGGGGRKVPALCFQPSRTSLLLKIYLRNFATFTKIYWKARFRKKVFVKGISCCHGKIATQFSTPCLVKF